MQIFAAFLKMHYTIEFLNGHIQLRLPVGSVIFLSMTFVLQHGACSQFSNFLAQFFNVLSKNRYKIKVFFWKKKKSCQGHTLVQTVILA